MIKVFRLSTALKVLAACLAIAAPARGAEGPQLVRLQQGKLRIDVTPTHGGDLSGLEVEQDGRWIQLLYRGDDYTATTDWTGKAPVLWPATGRNLLPSGEPGWRLDGIAYPMPIHGFARDLPWKLERVDNGTRQAVAILVLRDSAATRTRYPFGFKLTTEYVLSGGALIIRQTVQASRSNSRPMPFSIGNHISFNLPLVPGGDAAAVRFQTPARREVLTDTRGLPTGEVEAADFQHPSPVAALGTRVAHSMGDYPSSQSWVRLTDPSGLVVNISHVESREPAGAPVLFNLWGDVGAGFFAPEPWVGKQNALATGDGAITLSPGQTFRWAISIVVDNVAGQ